MIARLSSWFASAAQLREIFVSTADRRAEFFGCAPSNLYSAAKARHCSTEGILALPLVPNWLPAIEGNILVLLQFLPIFPVGRWARRAAHPN